jgi:hypothetical protein
MSQGLGAAAHRALGVARQACGNAVRACGVNRNCATHLDEARVVIERMSVWPCGQMDGEVCWLQYQCGARCCW